MAADARAIANIFLDWAEVEGLDLSAMSLLKILYFAHAWHLAKYKQPLVAQPFEAWQNGPVNRVVYEQIKRLGKKPIKHRLQVLDSRTAKFVAARCELGEELKQFLHNIFSYYSRFDALRLSDITHAEGTPWDRIWQTAESSAVPGMWIPDALILEWFESTGGRLYLSGEQGANG
jgi:uncharacterized phage-associated protein